MNTIHDSKYQTILFDEKTDILYEIWKTETQTMQNKEFKAEMQKQLEAITRMHPKAVLTDTFLMQYVITIEMQEWLNTVIFPQFINEGVTKIAMLLPTEIIAQLSIEQSMEEEVGSKFQLQYFSDKAKAEQWLL